MRKSRFTEEQVTGGRVSRTDGILARHKGLLPKLADRERCR